MLEIVIVDGYNIIGAWPELRKLKDVKLDEARDRLIEMLADYQAYAGNVVYVVFDAHQVPGLGGRYEMSSVRILYTREKETADELIERLVAELAGRRKLVYVATSDMTEQHVVFGRGALRMPARELLLKVRESRKEVRERIDRTDAESRNTLGSNLSKEMLQLFEKWRRGK